MREQRDMPTTVLGVADDGSERELGRFDAGDTDLRLVSALCRLQLLARRRGGHVRLRAPSDDLRELLALVGLDDVLGLEAGGEPELGEQRRPDEVVQADDPLA